MSQLSNLLPWVKTPYTSTHDIRKLVDGRPSTNLLFLRKNTKRSAK